VRERGRRGAESAVEEHLARRAGEEVVAADHVRDPHVVVVDHHAEVVDGHAVRAHDDEVVQIDVPEHDPALHVVVDDGLTLERGAEAERVGGAAGGRRRALTAGAVVGGRPTRSERRLPARLELLGRAPAAIDGSGGEQRLGARSVEVQALALMVRTLVPGEAEPAEALEDGARRLLARALAVGVLDAQHEGAAVVAREEVAEERGADASDVERAAGTRREARPDRHRAELIGWRPTCQIRDASTQSRVETERRGQHTERVERAPAREEERC